MNPSVAGGNHAAVWVERQVIEWFKSIFGFPRESMGLLVSGSSAAAITALAVARHAAATRIGWDMRRNGAHIVNEGGSPVRDARLRERGGALVSPESRRAARPRQREHSHRARATSALRMRPDALDAMLAEDIAARRAAGCRHRERGHGEHRRDRSTRRASRMCARATACGCTWTAATARPRFSPSEYRAQLAAIGRADSVGIDAHKWMYVPVDAGMVLIRDAKLMRDTFSLVPPYLRSDDDRHGVQGPPWLSEYGSEQTRPFRALKVWMALRYFGTSGYARLIAHDIAMARRLADRVRATPELELLGAAGAEHRLLSRRAPRSALHGARRGHRRAQPARARVAPARRQSLSLEHRARRPKLAARLHRESGHDAARHRRGARRRAGGSASGGAQLLVEPVLLRRLLEGDRRGNRGIDQRIGIRAAAETPRVPPAHAEQLVESLLLEANRIVIDLDRRPDERRAESRGVEALAIGDR